MSPDELLIPLIQEDDIARLAHFGLAIDEGFADDWNVELLRTGVAPHKWVPRISTPIVDQTHDPIVEIFDAVFRTLGGRPLRVAQRAHLTTKQRDALRDALWRIGVLTEDWVFSGSIIRRKEKIDADSWVFKKTKFPGTPPWLAECPNDAYGDYEVLLKRHEVSILLPAMQNALIIAMQQRSTATEPTDKVQAENISTDADETSDDQKVVSVGSVPSAGTGPRSIETMTQSNARASRDDEEEIAKLLRDAGYKKVRDYTIPPSLQVEPIFSAPWGTRRFDCAICFRPDEGATTVQLEILARQMTEMKARFRSANYFSETLPVFMSRVLRGLGLSHSPFGDRTYWVNIDRTRNQIVVLVGQKNAEVAVRYSEPQEHKLTGKSSPLDQIESVFAMDEQGVRVFLPDMVASPMAPDLDILITDQNEGHSLAIENVKKCVSDLSGPLMNVIQDFKRINDPEKAVPLRVLIGLLETVLQMALEMDEGLRDHISANVLEAADEEEKRVSSTIQISIEDQNYYLRRKNIELETEAENNRSLEARVIGIAHAILASHRGTS